MRSNARQVKLQPVDEFSPAPAASRGVEEEFNSPVLRAYLRRERSSAYWFAATKWGISGVVMGIFFGAFMMWVASTSLLPIAQDAVARGAAIRSATDALGVSPR